MENEFVPHLEVLELRKLGFDEDCLGFYFRERETEEFQFNLKGNIGAFFGQQFNAPLYQQAFRWFREKYGYDISIKKSTPFKYSFIIEQLFVEDVNYYFIDFHYKSYEEAQIKCLKKLIKIVKDETRNTNYGSF